MSPFDGNNAQSGFTLLELLVSIVLIGLIVAIVGASMRLGYRSLDKGEKKAEILERFKVSLNLMDAQIQSGIPLKTTGEQERLINISSKGRRILSGSRQIIHSWAGRKDMSLSPTGLKQAQTINVPSSRRKTP